MLGWLLVGYVLFVVYGSLVPLHYVGRSWSNALQAFEYTPWLVLGAQSRADWVSNGVLYLPVGYLAASWLRGLRPTAGSAFLGWVAVAFCLVLAVGVEFAQLFFPQRTVSLNDLLAEAIGGTVGVFLATYFRNGLPQLMVSFVRDPGQFKSRLLQAYVLAYLAFAFFPFDLLLTGAELAVKINSNLWGWWLADLSGGWVVTGLRLVSEMLLAAPVGFFMGTFLLQKRSAFGPALFMGLLFAVLIELGQFFIYSGVSQGLSVLAKWLGVAMGLLLYPHCQRRSMQALVAFLQRYAMVLFLAYVPILLWLNGGFKGDWQGWHGAGEQLAKVNFLPFYYQYFTTEAKALISVMAVLLLYAPLGFLAWAHHWRPIPAICATLLLATVMEASKLFQVNLHPDPTNVLLAGMVTAVTLRLLRQLFPHSSPPSHALGQTMPADEKVTYDEWRTIGLGLLAAFVFFWVRGFPAFSWLVLGVLLGAATWVWHRPAAVFVIVPMALPVFDLAHWSGRFFFDEFDALLLVCLGVAFKRLPRVHGSKLQTGGIGMLAAGFGCLLFLSFFLSAIEGLLPWKFPDQNAFNSYYSAYNGVRIFKGVVWGLLLWLLQKRLVAQGVDAHRPFATGMVTGLGLTVAFIFWERAAFSGLGDFSTSFRVTGPFSAMHVGGAYIECFLAVATPFLLLFIMEKRHPVVRLAGLVLLLAATYGLMVTFSRSGYLAFGVAVVLVLFFSVANARRRLHTSVFAGLMGGTMLLVAMPIYNGDFAQARLATVQADLAVHQAHWDNALRMRDPDGITHLFGMGLGSYPRINYWRSTDTPRSGSHRLAQTDNKQYLRLASGSAVYVDQLVDVESGQVYRLGLDVRAHVPDAQIRLPMCEKWLLTSFDCAGQTLSLGPKTGVWQRIETRVDTRQWNRRPGLAQRPAKLSLYYLTPNSVVDVDNLTLHASDGTNLLRNGDFSSGLDHWFFATDSHLQWHIKSLFYGVLFDQGWLGLVSLLALLLLAAVRATRRAGSGNALASVYLAALCGFVVLGFFDTLIDSPRFLLLLLLLVGSCLERPTVVKSLS
jgi:VanZ family protein